MSEPVAILVAVALLAGNAFFVGAEFALISARRTQIEPRAAAGSRAARTTLRAMEQVSLMMAGAQLGITVCSLGLGAVGEPAVAHLLERPFAAAGMPEDLLHPVAFVLALTIVVFLHMVLGEMVPKNIAIAGPERSALALGPPLYAVVRLLRPAIVALNALANGVLRLLKVEPKDEISSTFTRAEIAGMIGESREEGLLEEDDYELLSDALEFTELSVDRVLLPLDELVTVGPDVTADQVQEISRRSGYSRFPVRGEAGVFAGYVHLKDAVTEDHPEAAVPVRALPRLRPDAPLHQALGELRRTRAHLAVVADDQSIRGVVALEDVLEELVGEVRDAATRPGTSAP